MSGPDLVSANIPLTYPLRKLFGAGYGNLTQANISPRSNLEWAGIGNLTDSALAATGVCASVAVPVEVGDQISSVVALIGATAASLPTQGFAALYSGASVPALLAQSVTSGTVAVAASGSISYALASTVNITSTNAPNGIIYASISYTATTIPTAVSFPTPTATQYQWLASSPLFLAATHGSAVGATAPATIVSPTARTQAPAVLLR